MPVKKRKLLVHHKEKEKYGKCTTEKEAAYIFYRKDIICGNKLLITEDKVESEGQGPGVGGQLFLTWNEGVRG